MKRNKPANKATVSTNKGVLSPNRDKHKDDKSISVIVPIKVTLANVNTWSQGTIPFGFPPSTVTQSGKEIGAVGADMGGTPYVELNGARWKINQLDMFNAIQEAVKDIVLPTENPQRRKLNIK